ncbi:hypothetical protein KL919_005097 [Ogataea angusta]|nr:hypothetical protein KL943_004941 [Ogataea angusta]KAG7854815.1 hypothetical protein KL919_005097 [Ogataea angusta]
MATTNFTTKPFTREVLSWFGSSIYASPGSGAAHSKNTKKPQLPTNTCHIYFLLILVLPRHLVLVLVVYLEVVAVRFVLGVPERVFRAVLCGCAVVKRIVAVQAAQVVEFKLVAELVQVVVDFLRLLGVDLAVVACRNLRGRSQQIRRVRWSPDDGQPDKHNEIYTGGPEVSEHVAELPQSLDRLGERVVEDENDVDDERKQHEQHREEDELEQVSVHLELDDLFLLGEQLDGLLQRREDQKIEHHQQDRERQRDRDHEPRVRLDRARRLGRLRGGVGRLDLARVVREPDVDGADDEVRRRQQLALVHHVALQLRVHDAVSERDDEQQEQRERDPERVQHRHERDVELDAVGDRELLVVVFHVVQRPHQDVLDGEEHEEAGEILLQQKQLRPVLEHLEQVHAQTHGVHDGQKPVQRQFRDLRRGQVAVRVVEVDNHAERRRRRHLRVVHGDAVVARVGDVVAEAVCAELGELGRADRVRAGRVGLHEELVELVTGALRLLQELRRAHVVGGSCGVVAHADVVEVSVLEHDERERAGGGVVRGEPLDVDLDERVDRPAPVLLRVHSRAVLCCGRGQFDLFGHARGGQQQKVEEHEGKNR